MRLQSITNIKTIGYTALAFSTVANIYGWRKMYQALEHLDRFERGKK